MSGAGRKRTDALPPRSISSQRKLTAARTARACDVLGWQDQATLIQLLCRYAAPGFDALPIGGSPGSRRFRSGVGITVDSLPHDKHLPLSMASQSI